MEDRLRQIDHEARIKILEVKVDALVHEHQCTVRTISEDSKRKIQAAEGELPSLEELSEISRKLDAGEKP